MGFFDQLTVNGLIIQLENAVRRCSDCPELAWNHVSKALKAMRKIKEKELQAHLNSAGWKHVLLLSSEIAMYAAALKAEDAMIDVQQIVDQAGKWRMAAYAQEMASMPEPKYTETPDDFWHDPS